MDTLIANETIAIATESPIRIGTTLRGGRVGFGILYIFMISHTKLQLLTV